MHIFILRYLSFLLLTFFLQYFNEKFLAKVFNLEATLASTLNTHGSKSFLLLDLLCVQVLGAVVFGSELASVKTK